MFGQFFVLFAMVGIGYYVNNKNMTTHQILGSFVTGGVSTVNWASCAKVRLSEKQKNRHVRSLEKSRFSWHVCI